MQHASARFIKSSTSYDQCPEPDKPEFVFAGRSNVGKSSLINSVTGTKNLAKTSSTPGKTITINHFMVDESWLLADLPGYGYAKVSKKQRATWEIMIKTFLHRRPNLVLVFVLLDLRIEPMKSDIEFINWLGENQLPLALVFTKADKLKKQTELEHNLNIYKETLLLNWEQLPTYFITSSETGTGINELQTYIHSIVDAENEG